MTEAALFVMAAVGRNISPQLKENVPEVIDSILMLPESVHVAVRFTSLKLIGELNDWVDVHPEYLEKILNWLLVGLRNPDASVASCAAGALQQICAGCRRHMAPHFEGMLQIQKALNTFKLKPQAANGLVEGAAKILADFPADSAELQNALQTLTYLQLAPLTSILDTHENNAGQRKPLERNAPDDPVVFLDRIATVFRYVKPQTQVCTYFSAQFFYVCIFSFLGWIPDTPLSKYHYGSLARTLSVSPALP